jgi:hypothetical protein
MISRSKAARPGKTVWAAAAMAAALVSSAPGARAQGLFDLFAPSPGYIAAQLENAGYELRGPMSRRGDVYVCNVVGMRGDRLRLVIDAHTGRVLGSYPARGLRDRPSYARERDLRDGWDSPPRPPHTIGADGPRDGYSGQDGELDRPKPKPRVAKARPEPVAPTSIAPATNAPVVTPTPGVATPAPDSQTVVTAPAAESPKPAAPGIAPPSPEPAPVAASKPVAEIPAAPAPTPRPTPAKRKALNDLPVTPLD